MDTRGNDLILNLYLKLPYGQLDHRTPAIIELANLMGRSANTFSIRLNDYSSCDPQIQDSGRTGMEGGRKQCQPYWGGKCALTGIDISDLLVASFFDFFEKNQPYSIIFL